MGRLFGDELSGGNLVDHTAKLQPGVKVLQRSDIPGNGRNRLSRFTQVADVLADLCLSGVYVGRGCLRFEIRPILADIPQIGAERVLGHLLFICQILFVFRQAFCVCHGVHSPVS